MHLTTGAPDPLILPHDAAPAACPRATLSARIAMLIAVLLPILGLAAAIVLLWGVYFHWVHLIVLGSMYLLTTVGIGVGFHRLYTHRAFDTYAPVRFIWAVLGSMSFEGPLIKWVATHRKHHQHTDTSKDPHSPHASPRDHVHAGNDDHDDPAHDHLDSHEPRTVLAVLRGLYHAHVGWLFDADPPDLPRYVPDLRKDKVAVFVSNTFLLWAALGLILPAVLGGLITGRLSGVLVGFLWGGLVRILLVHHVTWSINSVCHLWGTRPFKTHDESRDNPILGLLALGEGWHNAHHAFPTSARHGLAWWKLDVNYLVIRAMALVGLAKNVRVPSRERIRAGRRVA